MLHFVLASSNLSEPRGWPAVRQHYLVQQTELTRGIWNVKTTEHGRPAHHTLSTVKL